MGRSVLLCAVDYFPFRHINEKNFWHDLSPLLAERLGADVPVLSFNLRPVPREEQIAGSSRVVVYNAKPARIGGGLPTGGDEAPPYLHRFPLGPIRRSLSLRRQRHQVDALIEQYNAGAVHFVDNFGDAMGAVKRRYPKLVVTASLPTWMDRLGPLRPVYHAIRRRSFDGLDAVVTPAAATARRMIAAGFPAARVRYIPWGITLQAGTDPSRRARGREILDVPIDAPLLLWTGFTQRSTARDLSFAVELAREVLQIDPLVWAAFVFKPADLRPEYESLAGERLRVMRTNQTAFRQALASADIFLSPVTEPGRTVTPPLTWLEAMSAGLPIVTTPADGASDVVDHGANGFIVNTPSEGARLVGELLEDRTRLAKFQDRARQLVADRFSIADVADQFVELWAPQRIAQEPGFKT